MSSKASRSDPKILLTKLDVLELAELPKLCFEVVDLMFLPKSTIQKLAQKPNEQQGDYTNQYQCY